MTKTLLLLLILLLAFFMAFIPHIGYAYPLHIDEWMHLTYAKTIAQTGAISFPDPFTGEGTVGPGSNVWLGYHVLMAVLQKATGIDWLVLWRFGPSFIFMLTVLCVYIFANKQGYGMEAAFFTCLIPTTGGLLGPSFMVPMALGLLFIPLSLYIAFYVKSWLSYLLLFLITCFLWSMHPTTAAIQGIVLLPFILINLKNSPVRGLGLIATLLLPVLFALPLTYRQLLPVAGQLLTRKEIFLPPYVEIPPALQIYGLLPLMFCFIGIIYLLNRGRKYNYGLLLGMVLLLVVMLAFTQLQVGLDAIFFRGIIISLSLISIIAGAGLYWLRTQIVSARILDKFKPRFAAYTGGFVVALGVIIILALAIPARFNIPYYHTIDNEDYRAFAWIRDNIGPEYEKALVDPWKATAFTAVTGKKVAHRIWSQKEPADDIIYKFLNTGLSDNNFIRENKISFLHGTEQNQYGDLIQVRKNIFITNPNISKAFALMDTLQNGSFDAVYGHPPAAWYQYAAYCAPLFLHFQPGISGGLSVAIDIPKIQNLVPQSHAIWLQTVPVQTGRKYIVGGWIRTENIDGGGGASIDVSWRKADGKWIGSTQFMKYVRGSNGWKYYEGTVESPPEAMICSINCKMSQCTGIAWYDQITFRSE